MLIASWLLFPISVLLEIILVLVGSKSLPIGASAQSRAGVAATLYALSLDRVYNLLSILGVKSSILIMKLTILV
jgi:hypothetical protein